MRAGNRAESKDERNQRRAVANVFASKAIAALRLLRRSPMMPEPTTSSAVLSSSPIRRRGVVMSNSLARSSPSMGTCLCDTVSSAPKVPTRFRYVGARTECANRRVADQGRFTNVFRHLASVHPAGYRGEAIR
jgi:hypothetical protein